MESRLPPIPHVRHALPSGGLEALLARPWRPLMNLVSTLEGKAPSVPPRFPLAGILLAPSTQGFLAALGKPLAVARELESGPGIWWLSTPDGRCDYIIFSDAHRKSGWKGGQICMAHPEAPEGLTSDHPGVLALRQGFEDVWGLPDSIWAAELEGLHSLRWLDWFSRQASAVPARAWPRFPALQETHPLRFS